MSPSSKMVIPRLILVALSAVSSSFLNSAGVYYALSSIFCSIGSKARGRPVSASMKISGRFSVTIRVSGSNSCYVMALVSAKMT